LAAELPDETAVYPTHGFGSFCAATQMCGTASTIGREKRANPALTSDESRYVDELLAGLDVFPAY
jgi:hydroxyacylglutathione hydrolase